MSDPLNVLLAELPSAEPDPERAQRTTSRCRRHLARHASRGAPGSTGFRWSEIARCWQPLLAAIGVAYLAEVIVLALAVYGGD